MDPLLPTADPDVVPTLPRADEYPVPLLDAMLEVEGARLPCPPAGWPALAERS